MIINLTETSRGYLICYDMKGPWKTSWPELSTKDLFIYRI